MRKRNIALALAGAAGAAVAVKLLTRARTVEWDDVAHLIPHAARSRFVNVDGIRIHYQEFGKPTAPPIVLIHGYTASLYVWKTVAPLLAAAGLRAIALDLVGFGYSEKPRSFEYSIAAQARVATRFMDRLGVGRANVLGSSYGGAIAATIALDYPERVEKLVLVSSVINDDIRSLPILRFASARVIGELITPFLVDSRRLLLRRMRETIHPANHRLISDDRIRSIRRPLSAADGHHSLLATSRAWDAMRVERDAHLITQPTLIIWGEGDSIIPIKDAYRLQRDISGAKLVVLTECGHVPQEEKPGIFVEFVAGFVTK